MNPRQMAISAGQKYYNTGRNCKYGHADLRYTATGVCVQCNREKSTRVYRDVKKNLVSIGRGLKVSSFTHHPDDQEEIQAFITALLFDRGIIC